MQKSSWSKPIWQAPPDIIALALILAARSIKVADAPKRG